MKTLLNARDKEEIIARLQAVHPTSPRLWGNMTAHQMVCHLTDGFRMYMGLKTVRPVPVPYPRSLVKWAALWVPMPWPKGFKTAPELDQQAGGTPPAVFDNDVSELRSLVDRLTRRPKDFQWQPHPHFGRMSDREWMRLAYLHMDHHLRQSSPITMAATSSAFCAIQPSIGAGRCCSLRSSSAWSWLELCSTGDWQLRQLREARWRGYEAYHWA